jgi:hypothetical protein
VFTNYKRRYITRWTLLEPIFLAWTTSEKKISHGKIGVMASPKNAGGAGFTDTRVKNTCLLAKWLIKLERGDNTLCCNLLRKKYLGEKSIYSYKKKSGSQFWKGVLSIRDEVARGLVYIVGDGKKARFWLDVWLGNCALSVSFPNLFDICNQKEWSIFKTLNNENVNLTFKRSFDAVHSQEWLALSNLLEGTVLANLPDSIKWCLDKKGIYTTKSLYNEIFFPGFENRWMMCIWTAMIPLKIKIFLWQVCNDKIQSAEQLKRRNWEGPIECKMCGQVESTKHIFVGCVLAKYGWSLLRDIFDWSNTPNSLEELSCKLVEGNERENANFAYIFGCLAWSLWLLRNDLIFSNLVAPSPDVCILRAISFMQRWRILSREQAQLWIGSVIHKLRRRLSLLSSEAGDAVMSG